MDLVLRGGLYGAGGVVPGPSCCPSSSRVAAARQGPPSLRMSRGAGRSATSVAAPPRAAASRKRALRQQSSGGGTNWEEEAHGRIKTATSFDSVLQILGEGEGARGHLNTATGLHRLAKLAMKMRRSSSLSGNQVRLLRGIMEQAAAHADAGRFSSRQLCNMLWAIGKLKTCAGLEPHQPSIHIIGRELSLSVGEAKPGEISMALWGCAALDLRDERLIESTSRHLLESGDSYFSQMGPRELAMISWSLATLNAYNHKLLEKLAQWIGAAISGGGGGGGGASGEGSANEPPTGWQRRVAGGSSSQAQVQVQPKDLSMIAWSFAHQCQNHWRLQECTLELMSNHIEPAAFKNVKSFGVKDMTQMSVSMAKLGFDSPRLLTEMANSATARVEEFSTRELCNMAWGYAKLYYHVPTFMSALQATVSKRLVSARLRKGGKGGTECPQVVTNLAWSLAVFGIDDPSLLKEIFLCVQEAQEGSVTGVELHQLFQVWLVSGGEWTNDIAPAFLSRIGLSWRDEKRRKKTSSARHRAVSSYLNLMGISHKSEGDHDIDIAVTDLEGTQHSKLAIEVDGPAHFTSNTHRTLGHTVLKQKILEHYGWTVVQVPFFQWDPIPHWASQEKKRFLQRKLGLKRTLYFGSKDRSTYSPLPEGRKVSRFD